MPDPGACRILAERVVAFPVLRWPDGPWSETATAVRTDVAQNLGYARRAKRALVAANARIERVGWQRLVAVLAGRSQLKHRNPLMARAGAAPRLRPASSWYRTLDKRRRSRKRRLRRAPRLHQLDAISERIVDIYPKVVFQGLVVDDRDVALLQPLDQSGEIHH